MNKKIILILTIPLLVLSIFALNMKVSATPTVNIGILFPKYLPEGGGGSNGYGGMVDGALLAIGQINAAGGINVGGTKELINPDFQDEGAYDLLSSTYNTGTTDTSMTEMLGKDQFIVGGFRTETTTEALTDLATYNTGAKSPVPFFISGASTTNLIGPTYSGAEDQWVFRVTPVNDTMLFETVAAYIQQSLAPQLARIYTSATLPTAHPGQFSYAVVGEGPLSWDLTPIELLTSPPVAPYGAGGAGTPGYSYFLGPYVNTTGVPTTTGMPAGADFIPVTGTYDYQGLAKGLAAANVHLIIDWFTLPTLANTFIDACQQYCPNAMIVGVDVPGQQQSHWVDTGGKATAGSTPAACDYEVNLLWSGTNTPMVTGPLPGYSTAFWNAFETYTASLPTTQYAAGPAWPMYTAAGAYEAIYGIAAAIQSAGTTDTSNPALLAAIEATNMTSLSGQFQYSGNDVYSADVGLNWTQYGTSGWGWARSEVVQWVQNTTAPASPAPDVGAQMNVVSPTHLVSPTSYASLPYATKTYIPPSMYSLATWDIGLYGKVGLQDLVILAKGYGSKPGDSNWDPAADILGHGKVDLADLVALAGHYNQAAPQWPLP